MTSAAESHGFIECYPKAVVAAVIIGNADVVRILNEAGSEAQFNEVGGDVLYSWKLYIMDRIKSFKSLWMQVLVLTPRGV